MTEDKALTFNRFMRHVAIGQNRADCWEWQGTKPDGRYGHFSIGKKTVKAHRWMYEAVVGPIPDGLMLRHRCDNPCCVNPLHLEPGTASDNMRDKHDRGRQPSRKGVLHPLAKLDDDKVREIRHRASLGVTHAKLSDDYGVRRGQIAKIIHRINWSHVA